MVLSPRIYIPMCGSESVVERCVGTCGHPFIPGGEKHESSRCLCAKVSRVNCKPCCKIHVFSW